MSSPGPRGPALNQYFLGAVAIILLCSLGLGASLLMTYHQAYRRSATGLSDLLAFRAVLNAADRISSERGPANGAFGRAAEGAAARAGRLATARQGSDDALAALEASPTLAPALGPVKQQLQAARASADALLDRPLTERDPVAVEQAIYGMFATYDLAQPVIDAAMASLMTREARLTGRALTARMLGEMRDYAGRLGSYVVIAIAQGRPMSEAQSAAFSQTMGRVLQLWQLVQPPVATNAAAKVSEARRAVAHRFVEDGLRVIATSLKRLDAGDREMNTASFTRAIVPSFAPIEHLRDAYLDVTFAELDAERMEAAQALSFASVTVLLTISLEILLLIAGRRLFFRPLMQARREVVRLAEGQLEPPIARPPLHGEMRGLFDTLVTLRSRLIEREKLDVERSRLAQQLKRQADTDGLTGVLNRGALERMVPQLARMAGSVGLILLDLDHFKNVNDRYGHTAGDAVLRSAAQRLSAALRDGDVLARFGGEEFAILVTGQPAETVAAIADRLREAIEAEPFTLPGRSLIALTASLGTAVTLAYPDMWQDLLKDADIALYEAKKQGRNRVVASGEAA